MSVSYHATFGISAFGWQLLGDQQTTKSTALAQECMHANARARRVLGALRSAIWGQWTMATAMQIQAFHCAFLNRANSEHLKEINLVAFEKLIQNPWPKSTSDSACGAGLMTTR